MMLACSSTEAEEPSDKQPRPSRSYGAAKNNPELFRDRFVAAMGMLLRVGSIIDDETKGHRSSEFGNWWKKTQSDPLLAFMQDVRNAEFKRGEARQAAHHHVTLRGTVEIEGALSLKVIRGGKVIQDSSDVPREQAAAPTIEPSVAPSSSYSVEWTLKGGGQYDGQEVLSIVDRHLAWLRDEVLPTAERLTR